MHSELRRRIAVTLCALLVFRIGAQIPIPGIDPAIWEPIFRSQSRGILGIANAASGGAIQRLSIFAIGIMPLVSAGVFVQLVLLVFRGTGGLKRRGERSRRTIMRVTLGLAVLTTAFQALGVAQGLQQLAGVVTEPSTTFVATAAISLTGGTLFLIWLSELITIHGIGNGLALLLFTGIVTQLPGSIATALEYGQHGVHESNMVMGFAGAMVALLAFIVLMELARRHIPVAFAGAEGGAQARTSRLSIKINSAGIMPVVVVPWFLYLLLYAADFYGGFDTEWMTTITQNYGPRTPAYMAANTLFIVLFTFIYTAFVLDPEKAAGRLKAYGGAIPGVEPGEATAAHLDQVVSRTTILGALYIALIALIPELVIAYANVPFYFGGVSALILVCVVLDICAQFRGQVRADGLVK